MNAVQAYQGSVRMKGHGRTLPPYLDASHPEARRGTAHLRTVDANLIVAWNKSRHVFEVWGPSLEARGWWGICEVSNERGRPYRGVVPWELICAQFIEAREGELSADIAFRANEERGRQFEREHERRTEEGIKYFQRGIAGELGGYGRHSADDIADGWNHAAYGQKPAPRGQVVNVPGVGNVGGGS